MQITRLYHDCSPTPLGPLAVVTTDTHLCVLDFRAWDPLFPILQQHWGTQQWQARTNPLGICDRIRAYFGGTLNAFTGVPLLTEGTVFQEQVWSAVQHIAVGTTISYGTLAAQLDRPQASRAVGMAVGRNRIALAIPCHRVVGASGQLTGYAWGVERKRWLLAHEATPDRS